MKTTIELSNIIRRYFDLDESTELTKELIAKCVKSTEFLYNEDECKDENEDTQINFLTEYINDDFTFTSEYLYDGIYIIYFDKYSFCISHDILEK